MNKDIAAFKPEFWVYSSEDGTIKIQANLKGETLWLSALQMSELFGINISGIRKHLKNIFDSGELERDSVSAIFALTASDGKTYKVEHYNLDAIISVGYRVNSIIGTRFRIWATQRLKEYLIKGFTMNDELLKQAGGGSYFDELLSRIRDIRSSEKVFWRKALDIYATSIDYSQRAEVSRDFFKVIQNKMHWASHGHTAAEIIYQRADAELPNMGLTNWPGSKPLKADTEIAKNYLNKEELDILNRIVSMYLDFAELQALNRTPMYMKNWIVKLDEFLKLSGRDILGHSGNVSHEKALLKARLEYDKWHHTELEQPSDADKHFVEAMDEVKQITNQTKPKRNK
ncbi:MAG: virulence RhuM family protein [Candidatus Cloacimonadaceae bacterium]|nr:virulence RhuM family protein [Candidatus Cloacimonadaceae bacterium]MDP3113876.1 virulence RhuM family protein [Candidatus Cloacimonadaceae bacterium]